MRLHRSEIAFAVLMSVILAAGVVLVLAYLAVTGRGDVSAAGNHFAIAADIKCLVLVAIILQASALCAGAFLIYPLIRTQVREEGKLRQITASLSAHSQTLEHAALTDSLTGMQNRRYFDDALREYLAEFLRIQRPVGLIILDSVSYTHLTLPTNREV